jgi:hypothetical protein
MIQDHPSEYLVKFDGQMTLSPHLVGMLIPVTASSLEMADQILG